MSFSHDCRDVGRDSYLPFGFIFYERSVVA